MGLLLAAMVASGAPPQSNLIMSEIAERFKSLQGEIVRVVKGYVEKAGALLNERMDAIEKRVAELPAELKGEPGQNGLPGEPGASVTVEDLAPLVKETVAAAVRELPPAEKGEPGKPGDNGKDADPALVKSLVVDEVRAAVAALPPARDGKDCDMAAVQLLIDAAVKASFAAVKLPKDGDNGRDGRDAAEIDVVRVDLAKHYARGTWARHAGGLVRAFRDTDPLEGKGLQEAGWDVMVNGLAGFEDGPDADDRTLRVVARLTDGTKALVAEKTLATVHDEGVWEVGRTYGKSDGVSVNGSFWIAREETTDRPGTSKAWRLAVKAGRDGKDYRGEAPVREPIRMRG